MGKKKSSNKGARKEKKPPKDQASAADAMERNESESQGLMDEKGLDPVDVQLTKEHSDESGEVVSGQATQDNSGETGGAPEANKQQQQEAGEGHQPEAGAAEADKPAEDQLQKPEDLFDFTPFATDPFSDDPPTTIEKNKNKKEEAAAEENHATGKDQVMSAGGEPSDAEVELEKEDEKEEEEEEEKQDPVAAEETHMGRQHGTGTSAEDFNEEIDLDDNKDLEGEPSLPEQSDLSGGSTEDSSVGEDEEQAPAETAAAAAAVGGGGAEVSEVAAEADGAEDDADVAEVAEEEGGAGGAAGVAGAAAPAARAAALAARGYAGPAELTAYERARRRRFDRQLRQSETYWRALVELADRAQKNNQRAAAALRAKADADAAYAQALAALPVQVYRAEVGPAPAGADDPAGPERVVQSSQVLGELFGLQAEAGRRHLAHARWLREAALDEQLLPVVGKFAWEVKLIYVEGDAAVRAAAAREAAVRAAHDEFRRAAGLLLLPAPEEEGGGGGGGGGGGRAAERRAREAREADLWLADAGYRAAVARQEAHWAAASAALAGLFKRLKDLEAARRERVRACLRAVAHRQAELWGALPALAGPLQATLDAIVVDRAALDGEIAAAVRAAAEEIEQRERQQQQGGGGDDGGGAAGEGEGGGAAGALPPPPPSPPPGELASPMATPLVLRCGVLQRKGGGLMGRWRPLLAVATAERRLHLFELPREAQDKVAEIARGGGRDPPPATAGVMAEAAYGMLMVGAAAAGGGGAAGAGGGGGGGGPAGGLVPAVTVDLACCAVDYRPAAGDGALEVTETKPTTGMARLVRANNVRRFLLRAAGQQDMVEWVVKMKCDD